MISVTVQSGYPLSSSTCATTKPFASPSTRIAVFSLFGREDGSRELLDTEGAWVDHKKKEKENEKEKEKEKSQKAPAVSNVDMGNTRNKTSLQA